MAYKLCRWLTLMPHACHPGFISCAVVNSTLLCYASDRYLTRLTWPAAVSGERYTSGRRLALMDDCMTEGMACQIWTACLSSKTSNLVWGVRAGSRALLAHIHAYRQWRRASRGQPNKNVKFRRHPKRKGGKCCYNGHAELNWLRRFTVIIGTDIKHTIRRKSIYQLHQTAPLFISGRAFVQVWQLW